MERTFRLKCIEVIGLFGLLTLIISCKSNQIKINAQSPQRTISEYEILRNTLVHKDQKLNFSSHIVLNDEEQKLDEQLHNLRSGRIDHYKKNHFFPPARNFYLSKSHIESDEIFHFISKMPKGGALHVHTVAMGDVDWVIERAMTTPEMHIYWKEDKGGVIKGQMQAYTPGQAPDGFSPVSQIFQDNPNAKQELRSMLTFDQSMDKDSIDIWGKFESIFQKIIGFVRYKPIFVDYIAHGFDLMIADHVQHVELRMGFAPSTYSLNPNGSDNGGIKEFVQQMEEAVSRAKIKDPEFTVKIIHANLRFRTNESIWQDMQLALQHRIQYPQWLAGYDLVAEEDAGHPTRFHVESFLKLDSLATVKNITFPLYLHDGESNWVHTDNLYDAICLGTKRIGHGFNLFRFPSLLEKVIENDICIEINPLSNQLLGYIRDLRMHPASNYLKRGVNCTISSDDPLIFDYQGLSYDYWNIFMAWELNLADLKKLSRNGIEYSALTDSEKRQALLIWESRWNQFIKSTLAELN
jgi:adenosine deaminase CECR1